MEDSFESTIPIKDLDLILEICAPHDIDPTSSEQAERFFFDAVQDATTHGEDLASAVRQRILEFRSVSQPPVWVQNPDWQFSENRPMVFVGQLEVEAGAGHFHDDAVFYLFHDPQTGSTKTVIQVA